MLSTMQHNSITFYKYQGTGNDFVMVDGRELNPSFSEEEIRKICNRKFGIGADGLIVLLNKKGFDFEMDYYNSDGSKSFCGNGSRCAQALAKTLGIINTNSLFYAIDGAHQGRVEGENFATKMLDVSYLDKIEDDYLIDTGSPHYIKYVQSVDNINVVELGREIRYSTAYMQNGVNVNFVEECGDTLKVRTYERGVENETLSCGTGVTAVAISYLHKSNKTLNAVKIETLGGFLTIELERVEQTTFSNIWLIGPAKQIFKGEMKREWS